MSASDRTPDQLKSKQDELPLGPNDEDLGPILGRWAYDEDDAVRRIRTFEGREVLQVRLPLGIEQYEIDGRPDGKRPKKQESWLHVYRKRAKLFGREFVLSDRDVERLYQEGLLYYYRYLRFFQIKEYRLCARDTRRNLRLLEFVGAFGTPEQAESLEQYRPYILRMNVMSRALLRIQRNNDIAGAVRNLERGARTIEELPALEGNQVFEFEKMRSLKSLTDLHSQLVKHLPVPEHVVLQQRMDRAVEDEDYEEAAVLRDKIRKLRDQR